LVTLGKDGDTGTSVVTPVLSAAVIVIGVLFAAPWVVVDTLGSAKLLGVIESAATGFVDMDFGAPDISVAAPIIEAAVPEIALAISEPERGASTPPHAEINKRDVIDSIKSTLNSLRIILEVPFRFPIVRVFRVASSPQIAPETLERFRTIRFRRDGD